MVIPTCSVSVNIIVCRHFSKWRIKVFLKLKRLQQPRHPLTLTAYPTPAKVVPPIVFLKMTAKYVKEITYMPLVTFFSVLERRVKTRKGVCNNPPWLDEG